MTKQQQKIVIFLTVFTSFLLLPIFVIMAWSENDLERAKILSADQKIIHVRRKHWGISGSVELLLSSRYKFAFEDYDPDADLQFFEENFLYRVEKDTLIIYTYTKESPLPKRFNVFIKQVVIESPIQLKKITDEQKDIKSIEPQLK
jgi:hypothetical protein